MLKRGGRRGWDEVNQSQFREDFGKDLCVPVRRKCILLGELNCFHQTRKKKQELGGTKEEERKLQKRKKGRTGCSAREKGGHFFLQGEKEES